MRQVTIVFNEVSLSFPPSLPSFLLPPSLFLVFNETACAESPRPPGSEQRLRTSKRGGRLTSSRSCCAARVSRLLAGARRASCVTSQGYDLSNHERTPQAYPTSLRACPACDNRGPLHIQDNRIYGLQKDEQFNKQRHVRRKMVAEAERDRLLHPCP